VSLDPPLKNDWDLPNEMAPIAEITLMEVAPFFALATLALCLETWAIHLWVSEGMSTLSIAGIHFGVVVTLSLWSGLSPHSGQGRQLAHLLTLFTSVLGPFGTGGIIITAGLYYWFKRSATPFSEWYESLFPDLEHLEIKKIYDKAVDERNFHSQKNPVIPFIDVLHYGTVEQKQAMIVLLIKNHHGKFASVLRKALEDSDGSVRVLAAKGMTKIEQHFLDLNMELERKFEDNKMSHSEFLKTQILNDDEYLYSGILDEIRAVEVRLRSLNTCKKYLRLHPDDLDIRFILGRIYLRNGQIDQATNWFEECIHKGFISPKIYAWYFECMFRAGQFKKLRETAADHFDEIQEFKQVFQPDVFEVIKSWAGQNMDSRQEFSSNNNTENSVSQVITTVMKTENA
jgi:polysaccharide biosynthesis protein PelE